jgi:hypothetical protein
MGHCARRALTPDFPPRPRTLTNPIHGDPADPNPVGIGPFGGGLPAKIDAGEVKSFLFSVHEGLLSK